MFKTAELVGKSFFFFYTVAQSHYLEIYNVSKLCRRQSVLARNTVRPIYFYLRLSGLVSSKCHLAAP